MKLTVNNVEYDLPVTSDTRLADLLRRDLGLTGTKIGCGEGQCGTCVVLLDGRPVRACIFPAHRAEGKHVLTIEGLAASWGASDELHPLQRAFIEHGAVQCGYCTPGMLMAAAALWHKWVVDGQDTAALTADDIKRALGRNACRCTGYASLVRAVKSAFHEHRTGQPLPPLEPDTLPPLRVIGRSYPRPDVVDKVTGAACFTDDYSFPGMLYGATLRAAHPHARILSLDTARAAILPGVHAVLTHADVPGVNRHGLVYPDWPVLCDDKVRYLGDAVAIVAADSLAIAAQALELIAVEYEPLPPVTGPEQARRPDAPLVHEEWPGGNLLEHIKVRHGDVTQGFAEADVIVEREYRTPTYEHMFMEPECSIGVPAGYDQHPKLTVYVGSQIPYADRDQIAVALDLPPEEVRVIGALMGGGFGGKEDIMGQIHAALLAQATGKPVKILYSRAESMLVHPKRHATIIRLKTGVRRDGALTAVQAEMLGDAGAYASLSTKVLTRTTTHATGPYQVPHARIDCYAMYTNNPPSGAFRGFGVTQSAFAVEQNMDVLAHELGVDPFELRRKNGLRVGATTATGQILTESVGLLDCLDWVERRVRESPPPSSYRGAALLILDEPTAVLTPQEVDEFFVTIRQMVRDGHAIIFISHKLPEVLAISNRITVLRDGRWIDSCPIEGCTKESLAQMMVGREVTMKPERAEIEWGEVRLALKGLHAEGDRGMPALRGVDLDVRSGEILGLAGVSGNGQRELAEVITGLRTATQGRVFLENEDVTGASPRELTKKMLAYIPEERMRDGMIQEFTVSENMILREHDHPPFSRSGFLNLRVIAQHADELIRRFQVKTPSRETPAKSLSGGNIQKVVLAREISRQPRVLIAAQPVRGLDIGATEYVHAQLLEQRQKGTAILLISEDLDEILALSDRIAVIYEGRIMGVVDGEEATPERLGLLMAGVKEE
ncbi:MAG TPA: ATP-binding cassette domain-containing protein [Chloroflexi bacterium]|nr:ATP-binding cassette domain-containing protein [Chloroflexota bacterium]